MRVAFCRELLRRDGDIALQPLVCVFQTCRVSKRAAPFCSAAEPQRAGVLLGGLCPSVRTQMRCQRQAVSPFCKGADDVEALLESTMRNS